MPALHDLYLAIDAEDTQAIAQLLSDQPELANSLDETPPPLHWAIYNNRESAVKTLLEHGAELTLRDQDRDATPLDYAVVYARSELIPVLISHGANVDTGIQVARKGAAGGYEEFPELPNRKQYESIVELLRVLGERPLG